MKISKKDYSKIESNVLRFLTDNKIQEPTISTVSKLHTVFCLAVREPNNKNVSYFKDNFVFNPDNDYFDNYYLNDKDLKDTHFETAFKSILAQNK